MKKAATVLSCAFVLLAFAGCNSNAQKNGDFSFHDIFVQSTKNQNGTEQNNSGHIIEFMRQKPSVTQIEIARHFGLSRTKVQSATKGLMDSGQIGRIGGKRYGKWDVKV